MRAETSFPYDDQQDFADADKGFITKLDPAVIKNDAGKVVWDNDSYASFLNGQAAESVHPSLWRQSQLVSKQGLFEVTDGIFQVRGLDLSNVSFIEGDTGVIVVDPLLTVETACAALELYREHRGDRPVTGLIYTHSHADHFGGAKGVITQKEVDGGVPVIAPEGFMEHAVSENVYTGTAMARR
ncbi:MAG TPA: MBL fold metallo-hydrolase, partial [Candidatus Stackebrandtia faecavium]|nr:MBL fold metallo-hydrolase [Candidatus Stackebrandtia faecavium]